MSDKSIDELLEQAAKQVLTSDEVTSQDIAVIAALVYEDKLSGDSK